MKIIVPFVLVLGTLVLLLVLAIILLFRKRRAAHAAHVEEQQSIAQRERRRSRRARRHGLLTRREIETIAVESTHCPNAATVVIHDDSSSEEDEEEGHAAGRGGGGKGGDGGAGGSLGGGCSSVTGSSIDDDRAEVLSGAGEGSSAAPPGGNRRELGGKAAGGGTRDCTDADHAVERDVEADVVSDIEAAKARRAKDPERSRAGDFTPGSTLTCAICLGTLCSRRSPQGCALEGAMPTSLGLATAGGGWVCLRVRACGWRAATPAGGGLSAAVPGGRPVGVGLALSAGVYRFRVALCGSTRCLGGGASPLWLPLL